MAHVYRVYCLKLVHLCVLLETVESCHLLTAINCMHRRDQHSVLNRIVQQPLRKVTIFRELATLQGKRKSLTVGSYANLWLACEPNEIPSYAHERKFLSMTDFVSS
jgi:hypothetical protein